MRCARLRERENEQGFPLVQRAGCAAFVNRSLKKKVCHMTKRDTEISVNISDLTVSHFVFSTALQTRV